MSEAVLFRATMSPWNKFRPTQKNFPDNAASDFLHDFCVCCEIANSLKIRINSWSCLEISWLKTKFKVLIQIHVKNVFFLIAILPFVQSQNLGPNF